VTTSHYLSFGEQTLHYFDRPHDAPLMTPLEGPAAWYGSEMATRSDWRVRLSEAQIAELDRALAVARATGKPTGELTAEDFPLPGLAPEIARWRRELVEGRGFQAIAGVPVTRWTEDEAGVFFWCFGLHLGRPGAQNAAGDLLGHVTDMGEEASDPYVRRYRTSGTIAYHCDAADVVGLLCLRKARRGGLSRIASSVTVYNELLRRRPDLAPRLYEPFLLDVRNEDSSGALRYVPVPPCRYAAGRLRTFYHSDYFRSVVRHADVGALAATEQELLDLYEAIASEPRVYLDMDLMPGDVQLLSNHTMVHSRTAYEDPPDPIAKRHLLRLWLSL
jgi:hypothetical protein